MANEKVLIVENEVASVARPLERLLRKHQFSVVGIAPTAEEAVRLAKKDKPAVVLMDIMLPSGDEGVNAAAEIRRLVGSEIVYLTGAETTDALLRKVAGTKPVGFLTKPATDQQVLALLKLFRMKHQGHKVVFVCYSREDAQMKVELCKFLETLSEVGVDPWDDQKILFGDNWREEIAGAVRRADVAILLLSVDFVNSRFIKSFELPALLKAKTERNIRIVNVYVRAVPLSVLKQTGLIEFHAINSPDNPLDRWDEPRRELEAWKRLCDFLTDDL